MKKFIALLLVVLLTFGAVSALAAEKEIKIILSCSNTAGKPHTDAVIAATDRIRERTNGIVNIEFHGGNEMFTGAEGIEAVMSDANVMFLTEAGTFSDYYPAYATLCAPFLTSSYEQVEALLATDTWKQMEQEAADAGVYSVTNALVLGPRNILSKEAVRGVADLSKLTLRVPDNTLYINIFKALGANYMALGGGEIVSAMQTGMINGMEGTAVSVATYVQTLGNPCYYTLDAHLMNIVGIHCGTGFWNSLKPEYQEIIKEEINKAAYDSNRIYAANLEGDLANLEALGCEVIELSAEEQAAFAALTAPVCEALPRFAELKAIVDGL